MNMIPHSGYATLCKGFCSQKYVVLPVKAQPDAFLLQHKCQQFYAHDLCTDRQLVLMLNKSSITVEMGNVEIRTSDHLVPIQTSQALRFDRRLTLTETAIYVLEFTHQLSEDRAEISPRHRHT
ncbi:hypothetical protein SUGI_1200330 [Cryptomeria japonica]|nr:hypothetical protein SUGI_1200330 [Cryptomeria japonica]